MAIKSYRDLTVWQKSVTLVTDIYQAIRRLPRSEQYGLAGQMRRAAVSVPANIAEGHGRASTQEYIRFADIASGSLRELETYLIVAHNLSYFEERQAFALLEQTGEIGRMLRALTRALRIRAVASNGRRGPGNREGSRGNPPHRTPSS